MAKPDDLKPGMSVMGFTVDKLQVYGVVIETPCPTKSQVVIYAGKAIEVTHLVKVCDLNGQVKELAVELTERYEMATPKGMIIIQEILDRYNLKTPQ